MNPFNGETKLRTNVFFLFYETLQVYSQIPETKSYEYIFCYIFIIIYLLHTELFSELDYIIYI